MYEMSTYHVVELAPDAHSDVPGVQRIRANHADVTEVDILTIQQLQGLADRFRLLTANNAKYLKET